MSARFLVEGTFQVRSRRLFIVHGQVLDGTVRVGQVVERPDGLGAAVRAVKFALLSAREGRENPALGFEYRDENELVRWQALALRGKTLELMADGRPAARPSWLTLVAADNRGC